MALHLPQLLLIKVCFVQFKGYIPVVLGRKLSCGVICTSSSCLEGCGSQGLYNRSKSCVIVEAALLCPPCSFPSFSFSSSSSSSSSSFSSSSSSSFSLSFSSFSSSSSSSFASSSSSSASFVSSSFASFSSSCAPSLNVGA